MPKKTKKADATGRDDEMSQISISLPKYLIDQIDTMANAENRNRSNFISNEMRKLVASSTYFF